MATLDEYYVKTKTEYYLRPDKKNITEAEQAVTITKYQAYPSKAIGFCLEGKEIILDGYYDKTQPVVQDIYYGRDRFTINYDNVYYVDSENITYYLAEAPFGSIYFDQTNDAEIDGYSGATSLTPLSKTIIDDQLVTTFTPDVPGEYRFYISVSQESTSKPSYEDDDNIIPVSEIVIDQLVTLKCSAKYKKSLGLNQDKITFEACSYNIGFTVFEYSALTSIVFFEDDEDVLPNISTPTSYLSYKSLENLSIYLTDPFYFVVSLSPDGDVNYTSDNRRFVYNYVTTISTSTTHYNDSTQHGVIYQIDYINSSSANFFKNSSIFNFQKAYELIKLYWNQHINNIKYNLPSSQNEQAQIHYNGTDGYIVDDGSIVQLNPTYNYLDNSVFFGEFYYRIARHISQYAGAKNTEAHLAANPSVGFGPANSVGYFGSYIRSIQYDLLYWVSYYAEFVSDTKKDFPNTKVTWKDVL